MLESLSGLLDSNNTVNAPPLVSRQDYQLNLCWDSSCTNHPVEEFAVALVGYLLSVNGQFVATSPTGLMVDSLVLDEWRDIVRETQQCTFSAKLEPPSLGTWQLLIDGSRTVGRTKACSIRISASTAEANNVEWLQSNFSHFSPIPLIALPTTMQGPALAIFNSLVVLASRFGILESADLLDQGGKLVAHWAFSDPTENAMPVYEYESGALFLATTSAPSTVPKPACWLIPETSCEPAPSAIKPVTKEWKDNVFRTLNNSESAPQSLLPLLQELATAPCSIMIEPLSLRTQTRFMAPIHDGAVSVLTPNESSITIGIDLELGKEEFLMVLLHSYGHILRGHIRPGDEFGHWDTLATIDAEQCHRRWDRDVQNHFALWFAADAGQKVESLEECTPAEKAQLGLWRMIGEMLGESRRLNKMAERYQRAAYQRQAAERIVAMLEDYGGAMLCDGVGLGKTYVATTVMVHYANEWRERHSTNPDIVLQDPFRITVLSPNSVVSTWRREAIPLLNSFGVPLSTIRVISHSKLSRITSNSDILQIDSTNTISDLEHLLLSDLVIVDEAHNFRSISATRTKVLRDLLRIQPRKDIRRRVALLTATPINNSLDDLRQQASLLFSRPLWITDARTEDGHRRQVIKEIEDRCRKARAHKNTKTDLAGLVVHGQIDARFSDAIEFRDDLDFGPNVLRIGDYLKEQDKKLKLLQSQIRATTQSTESQEVGSEQPVKIAEELLDRIVVQRSRALCKEIERQQGSDIELLFRPDQNSPEKLYYSDEYDGIQDVLARFLPLFDTPKSHSSTTEPAIKPLSLKVYMWHDLREGIKSVNESSPVVGLQRILVLKRLESSPVSFLITLLRLLVLHAHRLQQLQDLCIQVRDDRRNKILTEDVASLLNAQTDEDLEKLRMLATGDGASNTRQNFMKALSKSYVATPSIADTDDPPPKQLSLFGDGDEDEDDGSKREHLERLWTIREFLIEDLATLFSVTPKLADIIFGRFDKQEWPHGFIAGGVEDSDWPMSPIWGLRLIKDAKLRSLVARLITARRAKQKAIVFTQFSDTIAYIESVLRACRLFTRDEWQVVTRGLGVPDLKREEVTDLLESWATVTGGTEDRDDVVNAFAPFYRIGPYRPITERLSDAEQKRLIDEWTLAWQAAIEKPCHVLFCTDVLAEGVNLQDVSLLINFDVHWNPVRMIQRAGRIDRRLNPTIERSRTFPELEALAKRVNKDVPVYYYQEHSAEAPLTVNMILPDELEVELQLRERIATKTLAIDFTLGLEQGTGAEADWMEDYKYQGISSLNSFQKDRAIEQVAGYHEKLAKKLNSRGILPDWAENLHGWFRAESANDSSPLIGRAHFGRQGTQMGIYTRYLEPQSSNGVPHWLWSQRKPANSILNFWLCLDNASFPAKSRTDLDWSESASMPISAHHLLAAAQKLESISVNELSREQIGRPLMQGITALSAGFLRTEADRSAIQIAEFFLLQLESFTPETGLGKDQLGKIHRRGIARRCQNCDHPAGMHKCCSHCKKSANGEEKIAEEFGFRRMVDSNGQHYEVPQPWCRECRKAETISLE